MRAKKITVPFRRRREGKTDYRKRRKLLAGGKARLVLRKTLRKMIGQIVKYKGEGDRVIVGVDGGVLEKYGWKFSKGNIPAAYLLGFWLGKRAAGKVEEVVLDKGLQAGVRGNRIYACLKGVVDGGLKVKCSEEVFPKEGRIEGEHIIDYGEKLKKKKELEKRFSNYVKKGLKGEEMGKVFKEVKERIEKGNKK